jgi:hypothetical protein
MGIHMKRIVLCSVLALAVSAGGAVAKTKTMTITLDGFCDTFTLTSEGANIGLSSTNPACDPGIGSGYIGKVKGHGKYADLGSILNGDPSSHWVIGLQYPLVTGGTFTFGFTTDGINIGNDILTGTYSVDGTAAKGPRGARSATSALKKQ